MAHPTKHEESSGQAKFYEGLQLALQGHYEEALAAFGRALDADGSDEDALAGRITALRLLKRWEEAEQRSQEAVDAHPDRAKLWVERGWVFSDRQQWEEALAAFGRALDADGSDEDALAGRITALRSLKRWEEAEQRSQEAVDAHPDRADLWVQRGWVFSDRQQWEEALAAFGQAGKVDADLADVSTGVGAVAFGREDYALAETHFRSALEKLETNDVALTNLSWSLIRQDSEEKMGEADTLCRTALSLNKASSSAYNCLGVIAYLRGKLGQASHI